MSNARRGVLNVPRSGDAPSWYPDEFSSRHAHTLRERVFVQQGDHAKAAEAKASAEGIAQPIKESQLVENKMIAQQFREIQQACRQKVRVHMSL